MNLLQTLTQAADAEQVQLQALPPHAAASHDEHLRQHYALLLAALLCAQPQVSESQSRLLLLLLDALRLGDQRGALFAQARALEPEPLLEAARLLRTAGLGPHLLLDALVLLRLDAPLAPDAVSLIGELAHFLGLEPEHIATHAAHAADLLGLHGRTSLLAPYWPERLPQPLTAEALAQGLEGGLWYLESDLAVNFVWQAQNAVLHFAPGATLSTHAQSDNTHLSGCTLHLAHLVFVGQASVELEQCRFTGDYAHNSASATATTPKKGEKGAAEAPAAPAPRSVLRCNASKLSASDCHFATPQACAIEVNQADLILKNCQFIGCGHEQALAGAVVHNNDGCGQEIHACHFEACRGSAAGAIWNWNLRQVSSCTFIDCVRSTAEASELAVYTKNEPQGSPAVRECVFRDCSVYIDRKSVV